MNTPALLAAMTGQRPDHHPVWFMRQAGRSLPEYRAAREGTTMLQSCLTPDLAAEITCQPVRRHKVDAAVLYSDIMVPLALAGVGVHIEPGVGPVVDEPVRTAADVAKLTSIPAGDAAVVEQEAKLVVDELGETTPLIGFAGAPFTIAAYLVAGRPSRDHLAARAMMHSDPQAWGELMDWVARLDAAFLAAQVAGGARAVQLFDSWAGSLSADDYRTHVAPHSLTALAELDRELPMVHFGVNATHLMDEMAQVVAQSSTHPVMGVDHRITLSDAAATLMVSGLDMPLQGNINPALLLAGWDALEAETRAIVAAGAQAEGHIVNLGHGVPAQTDPEVLTRLVELVHSL
ncbi:uroporphyrinogen decarboxylase [Cutibacterium granulosum]|uniref:uroporphyrinogen decarboxylase n=1 Tax=Cutibacterium granulosum TaxID=33011 RepID=UPI0003FF16CE|nr:uroporphyrinogen decarboxylase [Cutibacterium granulosum]MEA5650195.1 uroporphyrinogen decarboxylase [Cutibacterium granulosum]